MPENSGFSKSDLRHLDRTRAAYRAEKRKKNPSPQKLLDARNRWNETFRNFLYVANSPAAFAQLVRRPAPTERVMCKLNYKRILFAKTQRNLRRKERAIAMTASKVAV